MTFHSTHTRVLVEDLRVEAFVGLHNSERDESQTISISITCTLEHPSVAEDDLDASFDYVPIVQEVRSLALKRKRRLIETLAEEVAAVCFEDKNVRSVVVSVRKLHKLPAVEAVGVERTFERR